MVWRTGPVTGKRTAQMQKHSADLEARGDVPHAVIENGVARDPQHSVLLTVPSKREADHVACKRAASP
jgi:hypothetical protein